METLSKEEIIKNSELFSNIDTMIKETLTQKSIKDVCEEFKQEVTENMGKYINDFKLALAMGEKGEGIVRMFLEINGHIFLSKCKDISHDYRFLKNGKELSYEIKTDVGHKRKNENNEIYETGNLAIEFECRNKLSGIAATQAEYWISYLPHLNEIWLIKVEKLKELIRINNKTIKRHTTGGDENSNTKIFLINRKEFKDQFKVINVY